MSEEIFLTSKNATSCAMNDWMLKGLKIKLDKSKEYYLFNSKVKNKIL